MQLIEGRKIYLFEFVDCSNSVAGKTNWKLKPGDIFSGSCTVKVRAVGDGLPGAHLCAGSFVLRLLLRCRLQQQCLFSSPTQPHCVCHAKGSPCRNTPSVSCPNNLFIALCVLGFVVFFFFKGKGKCGGGKMHKSKQKHPIVSKTFWEKINLSWI